MMRCCCLLAAMLAAAALAADTLNPVTFRDTPATRPIPLVGGDVTATVVAGDDDVSRLAAKELVEHVALSTGRKLPVVGADDVGAARTLILVGPSALTDAAGVSGADLPLEGFRVQTFAVGDRRGVAILGRLPLAGEPDAPNGTLWGVYDWLERYLGVRWYYPDDDGRVIPEHGELTQPAVHYTDAPVMLKRTAYLPMPGVDWKTMLRRYRTGNSSPAPWTACHSPGNWHAHYEEYPETFELQLNGDRHRSMPCYGNPQTAEVYLADIERFYATGDATVWQHPNAKVKSLWFPPTAGVIPISPPDKGVACCCEYCKALWDPDADRSGRASRVVAEYVRRVAEGVRARWPDKYVWYLPYSNYTIPPPDLELPDNVIVGLCLMRGTGNAKEPAITALHDQWIAGWHRITGRPVHLWEYLCWPADDTALPFQYPHVLRSFYQRHREDVEGSFINGGYPPAGLFGGNFASFHPTIYCWLRLMWNPDFDVDAAVAEETRLLYGPAAEPMGRVMAILTDRWEQTRWQTVPGDHHVSPRQIHEETMPRAEVDKLLAALAEARKLAGDDGLWRRRVDYLGKAVDIFDLESKDYHGLSEQPSLPTLPVLKVGALPEIDGRLDDACWTDAVAQPFVNATNRLESEPAVPTALRAVWTDTGIVFGVRCAEPTPAELRRQRTVRDQDVYADDCVEFFIDPAGTRDAYCQIVVNTLGTIFDRHSREGTGWNAPDLQVAADVGADFWSAELYVPFAALPKVAAPKIGDHWFGNVCRSRYAGGQFELTRWSTRLRPSNLDFSAFGEFRFVE